MTLVPEEALRRLDAVPIGFRRTTRSSSRWSTRRTCSRSTTSRCSPTCASSRSSSRARTSTSLLQRLDRLDGELVDDDEPEDERGAVAPEAALERAADDGPTVKLVRSIISQAIEQGASDVHFDPDDGDLQVRYRIDGIMRRRRARPPPPGRARHLAHQDPQRPRHRRAPPAAGRPHEPHARRPPRRHPRHGRAARRRRVGGPARSSIRATAPLSLGELGHGRRRPRARRARAAPLARRDPRDGPDGLGQVDVAVRVASRVVSSPEKTIMTIEDPVEYRLTGVKQMQVFERAGADLRDRACARSCAPTRTSSWSARCATARARKIAIEAALTGTPRAVDAAHQQRAGDAGAAHRHGRRALPRRVRDRLRDRAAPRAAPVPATAAGPSPCPGAHVGPRGERDVEVYEPSAARAAATPATAAASGSSRS